MEIPNDYIEGEHCFRYSITESMEDLGVVLGKIRETPQGRLECMAIEALLHTMTFHTPEKRAHYFLDTVYR